MSCRSLIQIGLQIPKWRTKWWPCKGMAVSQAFIFHFKWYSLLPFAVCQLLCWAFLSNQFMIWMFYHCHLQFSFDLNDLDRKSWINVKTEILWQRQLKPTITIQFGYILTKCFRPAVVVLLDLRRTILIPIWNWQFNNYNQM